MTADATPTTTRRLHPGWFALTLLIATYGTGWLVDSVWSVVVEREWWYLPLMVPGACFLGWVVAGSWTRARTRGRVDPS